MNMGLFAIPNKTPPTAHSRFQWFDYIIHRDIDIVKTFFIL